MEYKRCQVANYITIGENDLIDYVKDSRISLELRAKMLTDKEVSEVNFSVTTENGNSLSCGDSSR